MRSSGLPRSCGAMCVDVSVCSCGACGTLCGRVAVLLHLVSCLCSLPEFMDFRLFEKPILVANQQSKPFLGQSIQEVSLASLCIQLLAIGSL